VSPPAAVVLLVLSLSERGSAVLILT
jgi:hypothetical protein